MWYNVFQHIYVPYLCSDIAFEKANPTKISAPPISMSVVRVCVFRRGCQTYWLHLWKDGKWKILNVTTELNLQCTQLWTRKNIKTRIKTGKSSFETFLALALALVEMHKPATTLKGNFLLFNISTTIHNFELLSLWRTFCGEFAQFWLVHLRGLHASFSLQMLVLIAKWSHHRICMTCSITSAPIDWWGVSSLFCRKLVRHVCGQLAFHQVNFCRSVSFDNTYLPS